LIDKPIFMRDRRRLHKRREKKPLLKEKERPKKKVSVLDTVAGKAYSPEKLGSLIASLQSGSSDREIGAVVEFAENQAAISEAAANDPEVSGTEITNLVIAATLKNEQDLLTKLEKGRKKKTLQFVAKSSSIPPEIQVKAEAVLQRIIPMEKAPKPEKAEPTLIKVPYTPAQVKTLIKHLESKMPRIEVAAAIKFIKDYPKIAPVVAKIPMLTVTAVTDKAVVVIKRNPDAVIKTMVKKKMVPALLFLAAMSQVPLPVREKAQKAAERLKPQMPAPKAPVAMEEVKAAPLEAKEAPIEIKELPRSKEYTPWQLEALLSGLDSVERVRAVKFAIQFMKNYGPISEAIAKAPMLTVTVVSAKAVRIVEKNLGLVLKELKRAKDIPTLEFLANSAKFSMKTREKAADVLKMMIRPFEKQ
jgi:hypothetical protein